MRNSKTIVFVIFSMSLVSFWMSYSAAQETRPADSFDQLQYLTGDWIGEGGGNSPGQGTGGFSFALDLQGKIMVRRNYADYPATGDKPASRHDDLMIIYRETPASPLKAVYFDSEGHVIDYSVEISSDSGRIVFVTDAGSPGPRFRLSYIKSDENNVGIKFEMAPPDRPEEFSAYIDASAHRK